MSCLADRLSRLKYVFEACLRNQKSDATANSTLQEPHIMDVERRPSAGILTDNHYFIGPSLNDRSLSSPTALSFAHRSDPGQRPFDTGIDTGSSTRVIFHHEDIRSERTQKPTKPPKKADSTSRSQLSTQDPAPAQHCFNSRQHSYTAPTPAQPPCSYTCSRSTAHSTPQQRFLSFHYQLQACETLFNHSITYPSPKPDQRLRKRRDSQTSI